MPPLLLSINISFQKSSYQGIKQNGGYHVSIFQPQRRESYWQYQTVANATR